MIEIGAFEAKNTLGALLDRAEHGEEILITRRGKPVARLVPAGSGFAIGRKPTLDYRNSSSSVFASTRSGVSSPSVNHP
jgi:prevent-host-death family protein